MRSVSVAVLGAVVVTSAVLLAARAGAMPADAWKFASAPTPAFEIDELADGSGGDRADDSGSPEVFGPELDRALLRSRTQPSPMEFNSAVLEPLLEINLIFHVLSGPGSAGDVSDELLREQMAVLNESYRSAGFHFNLAEVRRYSDSPYFSGGCFPTTERGISMKFELAIDPARFVNIYSCRLALPFIAGYGSLPNEFPEADPRHGVVIDYGSMPGSPPPLSLGHTLVHELGHYLGLLHSFQGGCTEPGDSIPDTPAQASPGFGCLIGRDSCPQAGADPVSNFMDYSDDTCTDNFTPLQGERMRTLIGLFRPSLVRSSTIAPAPISAISSLALVGLALLLLLIGLLRQRTELRADATR